MLVRGSLLGMGGAASCRARLGYRSETLKPSVARDDKRFVYWVLLALFLTGAAGVAYQIEKAEEEFQRARRDQELGARSGGVEPETQG